MAIYIEEQSRTFSEYLLIPNLTTKDITPENVNLTVPAVRFRKGEKPSIVLNIPFASAVMQSVSDDAMAIALAKCGGISFIYCSQPIEKQAEMVKRVKKHKAGFVISDSNISPESTLRDVLNLKKRTGHSTIAVTDDGTSAGKLLGIVTNRDYRAGIDPPEIKVGTFMTGFDSLICGKDGITLKEANDMIWKYKLNCFPVIDSGQRLLYLVFRKDYDAHKENPQELLDNDKRYMTGAGINTRDYRERVAALVESGADLLCIDSSDGFNEWQRETIGWVKSNYKVCIGAGNIIDRDGFFYLAESGADFIKVGIGGGSICITREQKGIGRGQASAIIDVARARDEYFRNTGVYIPVCSDGGIVYDYHIALALAMGADFVMLGRYFARFDESPTLKMKINDTYVKEYWGEGSNRARNWQRYDLGGETSLDFEEGVDSFVPYAGKLKDNLNITLSKIKSTMCNCGSKTIEEFQKKARVTLVSATSIVEGGAHDVLLKDKNVVGE